MTNYAVLYHPIARNDLAEQANGLAVQNPDIIVIGGVDEVPQELNHLIMTGYQLIPTKGSVSMEDLNEHAVGTDKVVAGFNVI